VENVISPLAFQPLLFSLATLHITNAAFFRTSTGSDAIRPGQSLNTSEYIRSADQKYGFCFSPSYNGTKYRLVIYTAGYGVYHDRIVWVANKENSYLNPSAVLTLDPDGNLAISDGKLFHHYKKISPFFMCYKLCQKSHDKIF
jgi:hypothetical protein